MLKLNDRQKALLNDDAIVRIEAGYVNLESGTLTEAGRGAMWLILTEKYGKEFTASAKAEVSKATKAELLANAKSVIANS